MSKHVGQIKDRLTLKVKLVNETGWSQPSYGGWGYDDITLYVFKDSDGNIYTWKTTGVLCITELDDEGYAVYTNCKVGDDITIKGTVKAHTEYKGEAQTQLTRVKLISIDRVAPTKKELDEAKRDGQLASLKGDDFTWEIPYKQYKQHYSDCETLAGSYKVSEETKVAYITIIVREGRLKASGVRGQHFSEYRLEMKRVSILYIKLYLRRTL